MSTTRAATKPVRRPVTLADVAAASGVHAATVSRAITRPDLVRADTLQRVRDAIDALGYVPNRAARQLAGGATATIAVLVPDIANPFFSIIVQAAQRHAGASGTLVLLADTAMDPTTELDALGHLAPNVDGLIVCSPTASTAALTRAAGSRPLVLVNRRATGIASVTADQQAVVDLAVDHLASLGHDRIAVLGGPAGYWSTARRAAAIARTGVGGDRPVLPLGASAPTFDAGPTVLDQVLGCAATAVVTFNDVQALGVLAAAAGQGLIVPDDLSVVGVDGVPSGAMAVPALTTVAVDLEAIGRAAVDLLRAGIAGEPTTDVVIEPALLVRASTAPPGATVPR